ncbi:MAG: hypothetical protein HN904_09915, partial [Victivallales bacterium]|nr:hypothetical protein [Victivallales bacterium]
MSPKDESTNEPAVADAKDAAIDSEPKAAKKKAAKKKTAKPKAAGEEKGNPPASGEPEAKAPVDGTEEAAEETART